MKPVMTLCATLALTLSLPAAADAEFDACLARLRAEAPSRDVSTAAFDRFTADLAPDPSVLE